MDKFENTKKEKTFKKAKIRFFVNKNGGIRYGKSTLLNYVRVALTNQKYCIISQL